MEWKSLWFSNIVFLPRYNTTALFIGDLSDSTVEKRGRASVLSVAWFFRLVITIIAYSTRNNLRLIAPNFRLWTDSSLTSIHQDLCIFFLLVVQLYSFWVVQNRDQYRIKSKGADLFFFRSQSLIHQIGICRFLLHWVFYFIDCCNVSKKSWGRNVFFLFFPSQKKTELETSTLATTIKFFCRFSLSGNKKESIIQFR